MPHPSSATSVAPTAAFGRWAARALQAVLHVIQLENEGRTFSPTGLRFRRRLGSATPQRGLGSAAHQRGISPALAAREEPEVTLAWLTLGNLLEHFELLVDDRPVEPTRFALRRTEDWTFAQHSPAPMLAALASPCPLRCEFCYEDGLPDRAASRARGGSGGRPARRPKTTGGEARGARRASNAELDARLALWRRGLDFAGLHGLRYGEVLSHPRFDEVLRVIRRLSDEPFPVATAGPGLNEERIRSLAGRPRVLVQLSLNTCDPARRRSLMGDTRADDLLRALPLFRRCDVAFIASAVAWPGVPWDDLEATIRCAEEHGALHFVVFLPSFSRFFAAGDPFDWRARWREATEFVRGLRPRVGIPIRIAPEVWEAAHFFRDPLGCEVIGATVGSPAQLAGIRPGDAVIALDGAAPVSAAGLNRALEQAWSDGRAIELLLARDAERMPVTLTPDPAPNYAAELDAPFGLHIYGGPDEECLRRIVGLLRHAGARRAWVLSSQLLAAPYARLWEKQRAALDGGEREIEFVPVMNGFWGGNIIVGDLLAAADFARAALARLTAGARAPEVLLVPASPFHPVWWKDLTGASFLEIERRTGIATLPIVEREAGQVSAC